jgi:hypothetical protein
MRNRMLGRFGRLSGRVGAYEAIRDRFPLVAKSKEGSVGDMVSRGEGVWAVQKEFALTRGALRVLVVTESDEQKQSRPRTNLWPKDPRLIFDDWRLVFAQREMSSTQYFASTTSLGRNNEVEDCCNCL